MRFQFLIILVAVAVAIPVPAEEPASAPPYLYVVQSEVDTADAAVWASAVAQTAKAHAAHEKGNVWAAYRELTGGPRESVVFLFPVESLSELDGWISNRSIVLETLGKESGREVLATLDLDLVDSDRLMAFRPGLSRPRGTVAATRYVWVARVAVEKGRETEFAALFKRLIRAQENHENGDRWLTFANVIGGKSSELLLLYGFDSFAELDGWPSRREVLTSHLGATDAARLDAAITAISETTTSLWQLEPSLSQVEFKN